MKKIYEALTARPRLTIVILGLVYLGLVAFADKFSVPYVVTVAFAAFALASWKQAD